MDRPEWITVAPDNSAVFVTLTNNSGRKVTDAANPRVTNRHGHIIRFSETGDDPLATGFAWDIFLLAGDPSLAAGGSHVVRSEEHTSELQSLMRISYAVFCLKKTKTKHTSKKN